MFQTLRPVIGDMLDLREIASPITEILSISPFSYTHHHFEVCIHVFTSQYQIFHRRILCEST